MKLKLVHLAVALSAFSCAALSETLAESIARKLRERLDHAAGTSSGANTAAAVSSASSAPAQASPAAEVQTDRRTQGGTAIHQSNARRQEYLSQQSRPPGGGGDNSAQGSLPPDPASTPADIDSQLPASVQDMYATLESEILGAEFKVGVKKFEFSEESRKRFQALSSDEQIAVAAHLLKSVIFRIGRKEYQGAASVNTIYCQNHLSELLKFFPKIKEIEFQYTIPVDIQLTNSKEIAASGGLQKRSGRLQKLLGEKVIDDVEAQRKKNSAMLLEALRLRGSITMGAIDLVSRGNYLQGGMSTAAVDMLIRRSGV